MSIAGREHGRRVALERLVVTALEQSPTLSVSRVRCIAPTKLRPAGALVEPRKSGDEWQISSSFAGPLRTAQDADATSAVVAAVIAAMLTRSLGIGADTDHDPVFLLGAAESETRQLVAIPTAGTISRAATNGCLLIDQLSGDWQCPASTRAGSALALLTEGRVASEQGRRMLEEALQVYLRHVAGHFRAACPATELLAAVRTLLDALVSVPDGLLSMDAAVCVAIEFALHGDVAMLYDNCAAAVPCLVDDELRSAREQLWYQWLELLATAPALLPERRALRAPCTDEASMLALAVSYAVAAR